MTSRWVGGCGILLIGLGVLLFLSSAGLITVDFWRVLFPLFMIGLGALTIWIAVSRGSEIPRTHLAVPLGSSREGRVRVRYGAGRLSVAAGAGSENLVEVDALGGAVRSERVEGQVRVVELQPPTEFLGEVLAPWRWAGGDPPSWRVRLQGSVPLKLEIEAGACESQVDLAGLQVRAFDLMTGASSSQITMPMNAGKTTATIRAGAAEVKILVPLGVAARVLTQAGLGEVRVNQARFPAGGGGYQSLDYETAPNRVELRIEVGAGSVAVE